MMHATRSPIAHDRPGAITLPPLQAERLVGVGFRCWMAGLDTGDINCWQTAFEEFSGCVGVENAKSLVPGLSNWVRAVRGSAQRGIETSPRSCRTFCRDECLAIAMVAACQHNLCPALKACAYTLIGSSNVDRALNAAETFAGDLRRVDQILSPDSVCNAAAFMAQGNALAV